MTFRPPSLIVAAMASSPSSAGGPYGLREIRSLYPAVTERHLRYLEKWGLLRQPGASSAPREYTFTDLLTIRQVSEALERKVPLGTLLRTLAAEREGQLQLDFVAPHGPSEAPRAKVVSLEARKPPRADPAPAAARLLEPQAALAAKYFIEGSRLDEGDERTMEEAADAYRKALVVDPDLVPALVNLANIHYGRDQLIEAQALYERAIRLDPACFEAHFNAGNIQHDLGRFDRALACYREAVALNPIYADAHFYLAVTLEKTGRSAEARAHWRTYQTLAPDGEWTDLAGEFLEGE